MCAAGLPRLTCLCLRGCRALPASALWALRACPDLAALDLRGLAQVADDAGAPLAALAGLRALQAGGTRAGDGLVEALTFRLRMDAWSRETGALASESWQPSKGHMLWLAALAGLRELIQAPGPGGRACIPTAPGLLGCESGAGLHQNLG